VGESNHEDDQLGILNFVEDAIVADADSPKVFRIRSRFQTEENR